jgi:hypothetical protein
LPNSDRLHPSGGELSSVISGKAHDTKSVSWLPAAGVSLEDPKRR